MTARVSGLSLKERLTLEDLEQILRDIHVAIEEELGRQPSKFLVGFILPQAVNIVQVQQEKKLFKSLPVL